MAMQLNEQGAAEHLNLSPKTLRKWRSLGKGPIYSQMGRAIRYNTDDLDEWSRLQRKVPGSYRASTTPKAAVA